MHGSRGERFILQRPEGYDKALPNYLAKEEMSAIDVCPAKWCACPSAEASASEV